MTLQIRRATVADASLVARLNEDVQRVHADALPRLFKATPAGALSLDEAGALLENPSNRVLIGLSAGQPVGYIYAEIRRRPETSLRYAERPVRPPHLSHPRGPTARPRRDAAPRRGRLGP